MRILVVDDEFVSLQKLTLLLSAYGECDAATSGEQALEMFKAAHQESNPYQLITLDFEMPGMNGPEVVQHIRQHELDNGLNILELQAKILMASAMTDGKSIMASFREGCEGYLTKPFNAESIRKSLETIGIKDGVVPAR